MDCWYDLSLFFWNLTKTFTAPSLNKKNSFFLRQVSSCYLWLCSHLLLGHGVTLLSDIEVSAGSLPTHVFVTAPRQSSALHTHNSLLCPSFKMALDMAKWRKYVQLHIGHLRCEHDTAFFFTKELARALSVNNPLDFMFLHIEIQRMLSVAAKY